MPTASNTATLRRSNRAAPVEARRESAWAQKAEELHGKATRSLKAPFSWFTSKAVQRKAVGHESNQELLARIALRGSNGDLEMAFTAISRIKEAKTARYIIDRYHRTREHNYNLIEAAKARELELLQRK